MNHSDAPTGKPLTLPPRDADVTLLQHGTLAPPSRLQPSGSVPTNLPSEIRVTPRVLTATGARVDMPAVEDSSLMNPSPQLDLHPAPPRSLPMMVPQGVNTNSTLAGQHHAISSPRQPDPGLLRPVRSVDNSTRPPVGINHETSDVLQTFEAGPDDSHPGMPFPAVAQKTIPPGSGMTIPPPGKLLRHGPPALSQPKPPPMRPVQPAPLPQSSPQPVHPHQVLPLPTEQVVALVLEHRQQLRILDLWARGLEIAAGLAAVGVLIAIALGAFAAAGGFAIGAVALAAQGTTLRQVADNSARVAALMDALSGQRHP